MNQPAPAGVPPIFIVLGLGLAMGLFFPTVMGVVVGVGIVAGLVFIAIKAIG